ncbi:MAG TPA: hypothetical protein VG276_29005 [Actinomycetes bacterium]|nr:hypothetical protein [Actinomycetes bacterium]
MNDAPRCTARFERMQPRVWCMLDLGHDGDHQVTDTLYKLTWNDRAAKHVVPKTLTPQPCAGGPATTASG